MSLRQMASRGVAWIGAAGLVTAGLDVLRIVVMAQLIAPADFGLVVMLTLVLQYADQLKDGGFSQAIIHRQRSSREELSSLYWVNVGIGLFLYGLISTANPLIVWFYDEPRLRDLIPWAAVLFLITPFGQQFRVLLQKDLRFRTLALTEITATAAGVAVAIVGGLLGYGALSLIWGQLATAATSTLILCAIGLRSWPPLLRLKLHDLKEFLSFGMYQMGERTFSYLGQNLDRLIIGSLLGAQALGYYHIAYSLTIKLMTRIDMYLSRVMFPIYARAQSDNGRLKNGFFRAISAVTSVTHPMFLGLAAIAPVMVPVMFGEQWTPSITILQLLAIIALIQSTKSLFVPVVLSKGRADLTFRWKVMEVSTILLAIYGGSLVNGLLGIAWGYLCARLLLWVLGYPVLIRPILGAGFVPFVRSFMPALAISVLMAIAVAVATRFAQQSILQVVGLVGFGVLCYVALSVAFRRRYLLDLRSLFVNR